MDIRTVGISTSAFGYTMGVTGKQTPRSNPTPWTLEQFAAFAVQKGVGGIEAPFMRFIPDLQKDRLDALQTLKVQHDLFYVVDAEAALDSSQIRTLISVAQAFGSPIIRIKSSNILGLDRKKFGAPWREHVARCIVVLTELAPELKEAGIRIAIENHQDLDSTDLLEIVTAVGPDVVGVNYDIGNAFASCEDPMVFAKKLSPFILNIHLKDYKIFRSEEGYRLVRCALGAGAVDFKALIPYLKEHAPDARMVIELGAQEARNIAWLTEDFWSQIETRKDTELIAFFQTLEQSTIRSNDLSWQTTWENGSSCDTIVATEIRELEDSLDFLATL